MHHADTTSRNSYDEFVPFYDLCYADRAAEVDFFTGLLRSEDDRVLELGCGTGVIAAGMAVALAARKCPAPCVVGLDHSLAMLKQARLRHPIPRWVQGSMSAPPLRGSFDLVVCAFNTLQMLGSRDEVAETFEHVHNLLAPAGLFALDVYNPRFEETLVFPSDPRAIRIVRTFQNGRGDAFEIREQAVVEPSGESVQLDWRVFEISIRQPAERARLVVSFRHYSPDVLADLLAIAGFRILARYGDVRKSPFDERGSKKQVLVCSR
jgi:SAM-dependent methyltransferase